MMKWRVLALFFSLFFSVSLWAQEPAGSPSPPPPAVSQSASAPNSSTLESILDELEKIFSESEDSSRKVALLVTELQSRLDESRTLAAAASTSLESSANSLASSIQELQSLQRAQRLELWIWRGTAGAAVLFALVSGLVR
jgi:hypothetical protein